MTSNEENHATAIDRVRSTPRAFVRPEEDVCQRYAAMGLRFLSSHPEVRVTSKEQMVAPFLQLAQSF